MSSFLSRFSSIFSSTTATTSGNVAKERLSLIIASQRGSSMLEGVDMKSLQADVSAIVARHIRLKDNTPIKFEVVNKGETNLFEMQFEVGKDTK
ncbi:hypothetical protein TL16_g09337 [Triparma laevis f. inornata]|uniref:Cell division topological specificity factor n=2 Tax=Triparma laevis TaxID=1534972 RepID=A0A9W7AHW5_9STRA|nr:hypothetical protein TrLO_g15884 [Triparma laevis f. longispina]GMH82667.1 hypothetical protein TL16_g09337 [Triparma laevis f. inornata]